MLAACSDVVGCESGDLFVVIRSESERRDGIAENNPQRSVDDIIAELARLMLEVANRFEEYRHSAKKVKLVNVRSEIYYGKGYQDVQNRVPKISNTCADFGWAPKVTMLEALTKIFDFYRDKLTDARMLSK